mmetsp:Transcript_27601/g.69270  ORF Transcript_27601/g.69270 Transcript_27601/m.69270 type:complete len:235 (+) Transcript_27601:668-1372(+)
MTAVVKDERVACNRVLYQPLETLDDAFFVRPILNDFVLVEHQDVALLEAVILHEANLVIPHVIDAALQLVRRVPVVDADEQGLFPPVVRFILWHDPGRRLWNFTGVPPIQVGRVRGRKCRDLRVTPQVAFDLVQQANVRLIPDVFLQSLDEGPSEGTLIGPIAIRIRAGLVVLATREDPQLVAIVEARHNGLLDAGEWLRVGGHLVVLRWRHVAGPRRVLRVEAALHRQVRHNP